MEDENEKTPLMRENEVELTGCGATAACDPRRPVHKYLVLIVMCFLSFGNVYYTSFTTPILNLILSPTNIFLPVFVQLF